MPTPPSVLMVSVPLMVGAVLRFTTPLILKKLLNVIGYVPPTDPVPLKLTVPPIKEVPFVLLVKVPLEASVNVPADIVSVPLLVTVDAVNAAEELKARLPPLLIVTVAAALEEKVE